MTEFQNHQSPARLQNTVGLVQRHLGASHVPDAKGDRIDIKGVVLKGQVHRITDNPIKAVLHSLSFGALTAFLFALPALSIAGIPPFSGFVAKFALVDAGIAAGQWAVVTVSLTASLLTMYVMGRIWSGVFWGQPQAESITEQLADSTVKPPVLMVFSTVAVVTMTVGLMVFAGPLYDLAERTAADLLAPSQYIDAVLGADR